MKLRKQKPLKFFLELFLKIIEFLISKINNNYLIKAKRFFLTIKVDVVLVSEGGNWAIELYAKQITSNLKKLQIIDVDISTPRFAKNKIIHFGSVNTLITPTEYIKVNKSNKTILTWFHIVDNDERLKFIPILNRELELIHTSSPITKKILIDSGFDKNKICIIPLGVDLLNFRCFNQSKKNKLKDKFNLPQNKLIIGSFQKDGVGWGEGLEPKLIKGPDIFCEVVKKIKEKFAIHIFLTGPARGYVKKNLEKNDIPYTHIFFKNYLDIVECYNVLDLYIVTSRSEGGPKALLESMATGVPVVTTNVGMAPYLIENRVNGFKAEINNINQLYNYSVELLQNEHLKKKFIKNSLKTVQKYNWENLVKRYYLEIYKKIL